MGQCGGTGLGRKGIGLRDVGGDEGGVGGGGLRIYGKQLPIRGTLYSIVEFDLKFLPVPVTAYSQTSTLRSDGNFAPRSYTQWNKAQ